MRKEASLEQWKILYETTTRIKKLSPWEEFWDMDLIGVRNGAKEDTIFYSILGRGGSCYGVAVYEGYEGLNNFLMLTMQDSMNLTPEYTMFNQKNLTCYWGNREELSDKQRKIIKDLGYTYRGKNQWLYFISFEPGYYPYNMNQEEVVRMSEHMHNLEIALHCYKKEDTKVKFDEGNMFQVVLGKDKTIISAGEAPLPLVAYEIKNLLITDDKLLSDLAKVPKCKAVLEAEITMLGASVSDKKYERPANPAMALLGDANTGVILRAEMTQPEEDAIIMLAQILLSFILQFGAPREVRVSNIIVESGLRQLCDVCKIKLRRQKRLQGLEEFIDGLKRFRY